jgi:hypothetical protein
MLERGHALEGDILPGLGLAEDEAGILLREESFGDRDVEIAGEDNQPNVTISISG